MENVLHPNNAPATMDTCIMTKKVFVFHIARINAKMVCAPNQMNVNVFMVIVR